MSEDNGVYVLVTRGRRKSKNTFGKEYRVCVEAVQSASFEGIDVLEGFRDLNGFLLGIDRMQWLFGSARVFTDRKVAEGYSLALCDKLAADSNCQSEYQTIWLDFSAYPFPTR